MVQSICSYSLNNISENSISRIMTFPSDLRGNILLQEHKRDYGRRSQTRRGVPQFRMAQSHVLDSLAASLHTLSYFGVSILQNCQTSAPKLD